MFETATRRERVSAAKVAAIAAITVVALGAELAVFEGAVGRPLSQVVAAFRAPRLPAVAAALPARDALPTRTEEILVVAPRRPRHAVPHASVTPWRRDEGPSAPEPAITALAFGYCPVRR